MKKFLGIVAVATCIAGPAMAGPYSWSGFYIGGNVGAGVQGDQGWQTEEAVTETFDRNGWGGLAGGQVGFNYQINMLVLGIEGEGFWSGMRDSVDFFEVPPILFLTGQVTNNYDFDVAGRFGLAIDRALIYGKAGVVWGNFNWSATRFIPIFATEQASGWLDGLLIGLGLEYAIFDNWTIKFEYDYLGFVSRDISGVTMPAGTPFEQNLSANKNLFKVGFNYKFDWYPAPPPLIAK